MSEKIFYIKLAGQTIRIHHNYNYIKTMCKEYIVNNCDADFEIFIDANDLEFEQKISEKTWANRGIVIKQNSPAYLETLSAYRKIAEKLLGVGICLVHGACIAVDNKAYIFIAPSGTGKTTHIHNWLKTIPGTLVINGDKPLLDTNTLNIFGTPWSGKENMNTNTCAKLSGIIILERALSNSIQRITFSSALKSIIEQTNIPVQENGNALVLDCIYKLKDIPCYKLKCNKDQESAIVAFNELSKY